MKRIGEILLENQLITEQQLENALEEQKKEKGKKIGEILVNNGFISYDTFIKYLSIQKSKLI